MRNNLAETGDCGRNCCGRCCAQGCPGTGELGGAERKILETLAQYAFLPLAYDPEQDAPVCLEGTCLGSEEASAALRSLQDQCLISLDYGIPMAGFDYSRFPQFVRGGSIALTASGQDRLDRLEITGPGCPCL